MLVIKILTYISLVSQTFIIFLFLTSGRCSQVEKNLFPAPIVKGRLARLDLPNGALEPYLHKPVESHSVSSSDTLKRTILRTARDSYQLEMWNLS